MEEWWVMKRSVRNLRKTNTSGEGLQRLIITQPDRPEATKVHLTRITWLLYKRGSILSLFTIPVLKRTKFRQTWSLLREAVSIHTFRLKQQSYRSIVLRK